MYFEVITKRLNFILKLYYVILILWLQIVLKKKIQNNTLIMCICYIICPLYKFKYHSFNLIFKKGLTQTWIFVISWFLNYACYTDFYSGFIFVPCFQLVSTLSWVIIIFSVKLFQNYSFLLDKMYTNNYNWTFWAIIDICILIVFLL